ncbi:hypothetical protein EV182_002060 [Spiromyces aspiralis]|uniref:Uncharacterized protein n=1 Tax=Spiromyces aspiralis TaxID=68401 RepID=A0ACC1HFB4_9FUNG|nr:hypothetical protein EV182_002060 [Spiromyces aspiralis]
MSGLPQNMSNPAASTGNMGNKPAPSFAAVAASSSSSSANPVDNPPPSSQQQEEGGGDQSTTHPASQTPQPISDDDAVWFQLHFTPHSLAIPGLTSSQVATASQLVLTDVLENHIKFDRERGYHNHFNHHLLASLTLGATTARLKEIYEIHKRQETPSLEYNPQDKVTPGNLENFRSNDKYFPNWLVFYLNTIKGSGGDWQHVLETYFFHPSLFACMMSGLVHPVIQVGYGAEFDSVGIVAQGLALGSIEKPTFAPLFTQDGELVGDSNYEPVVSRGLEALNKGFQMFGITHQSPWRSRISGNRMLASTTIGSSLLDILNQVRRDEKLTEIARSAPKDKKFTEFLEKAGGPLSTYAAQWKVQPDPVAIKLKLREMYLVYTHLYNSTPKFDFFLMHAVTSSYFLPILLPLFSIRNQIRLLRAHWAVMLAIYVLVGSPEIKLTSMADPDDDDKNNREAESDERWTKLRRRAVTNNDMHLAKVIRSLQRGAIITAFPLSIEEQILLDQWQNQRGNEDNEYPWPPTPDWTSIAEHTADQLEDIKHFDSPTSGPWTRYIS